MCKVSTRLWVWILLGPTSQLVSPRGYSRAEQFSQMICDAGWFTIEYLMSNISTANKGPSSVNYHHRSLAFDRSYLSCNDQCDWCLFQEIIIFNCMQMFFKTGVSRNVTIFRGKHLCWSLFLIKLQALRPETLFQPCPKRDFNTSVFLKILQKFYKQLFFIEHLQWMLLSVWQSNCSMTGICQPSLLNQNKK